VAGLDLHRTGVAEAAEEAASEIGAGFTVEGWGWAAGPGYGYPGWWGPWIQGGAFGTPPAAGLADDETLDILKTQAQHLEIRSKRFEIELKD